MDPMSFITGFVVGVAGAVLLTWFLLWLER